VNFLVAGHIYDSHSVSIFPSPILINNVAKINALKPSFFMLLFDNYRLADSLNITTFK